MKKFNIYPFFSFEGGEGSGKTTCVERLKELFNDEINTYLPAQFTREPGGTRIGKEIRAVLLNSNNTDLHSKAELFMYLADRAQHVETLIRPALNEGKLVFSDRFADSTIVYQGVGRGLDMDNCKRLNNEATGGLWPCVTFYFDVDPEEGLRRATGRNAASGISTTEGRFEAEHLDFHTRLHSGYNEWAKKNSSRIFRINTNGRTPDQVFLVVVKTILMTILVLQKFLHINDPEKLSVSGVAGVVDCCYHLTETNEQVISDLQALMSSKDDAHFAKTASRLWTRYFYNPA